MAPWHHVGATMEITLDKNGSLYDPSGTESWNMQIRYETIKLTMHPTNNAGTFTRVPGGCLRWPPTPPGPRWPPALNLELERERTKEEKEGEVLHLFRCYTHTHAYIYIYIYTYFYFKIDQISFFLNPIKIWQTSGFRSLISNKNPQHKKLWIFFYFEID